MRRLFVDTFYLVALAHHRDQWHAEVMAFSRSLEEVKAVVDDPLATRVRRHNPFPVQEYA